MNLSTKSLFSRRGNALIATLIISATVGLAINLSSERMQGLQQSSSTDLARLQARLAAESVAAIVEGKLKERGASDTAFLSKELALTKDSAQWVLDIPGFANSTSTNTAGIRVGNCMVWWRVEPVRVWTETVKTLKDNAQGKYAVNPNMDESNAELDAEFKSRVEGDAAMFADNDRNFLFRIVTESYTLSDPDFVFDPKEPTDNPRMNPKRRLASAQATRVVQYTLVNLFEYAIFYAAPGQTGDLEFWQGSGMSVKGRVHSNGAIYIGGGGQSFMSKDYHGAASGNGGLAIGTTKEPTYVTAVDGIYRMRKPGNYVAVMNKDHPKDYLSPENVPIKSSGDKLDLNGDTPSDGKHTINGKAFTSANDSRSKDKLLADFDRRVTDKFTGATIVSSLANVPRFAGRPLESALLGGTGDYIFGDSTKGDAGLSTIQNMSLNSKAFDYAARPIYYMANPNTVAAPGLTFDPSKSYLPTNAINARVTAYNMRLYFQDDNFEHKDLTPPALAPKELQQVDEDTAAGFLSGTRTILLNNQLKIDTKAKTSGLVIRERPLYSEVDGSKNTALLSYPFPVVSGLPDSPSAADLTALAKYLKSQYQVRFYGEDITDKFFDDLVNADKLHLPQCKSRSQAIITEEFIVNRREADFMKKFFAQNENAYYVNLITLNLRRVQDFLAFTQMKDLNADFAADTALADSYAKRHFNGVVYVHRTRRSNTYHPLDRTNMLFNTVALASFNPPAQVELTPTTLNVLNGIEREKNGPIEIAHSAVRIRGGLVEDGSLRDWNASVNWQHDSNGDGLPDASPLGTSKMTIITPNPAYLWGDVNTTPYSDGTKVQRTPFAVFADSMTLLSASWKDTNVSSFTAGVPAATHTSYVTSFVINNIPCRDWNAVSEGTGAVANVCRFLENWGSGVTWPFPLKGQSEYPSGMPKPSTYGNQVVYTFMGSLVIMNEQRYGRAVLGAGKTNLNDTSFYSPPFRNLAYNTDLKLAAGQPPESLRALDTTRVVSLVNLYDN